MGIGRAPHRGPSGGDRECRSWIRPGLRRCVDTLSKPLVRQSNGGRPVSPGAAARDRVGADSGGQHHGPAHDFPGDRRAIRQRLDGSRVS